MKLRHLALAFLGLVASVLSVPARSEGTPATAESIRALVAGMAADAASDPAEADLARFYEARNDEPAWSNPGQAAALESVLADAPNHGLESSFSKPVSPAGGVDSASRDVALTRLALGYASALAAGRIAPEKIEADWAIPAPTTDVAAGLAAALKHDLAAWYDGLAPHHAAYLRLTEGLARYRKLAASGGWAAIPRGDPLKLGDVSDRVRALRARLEAEDDLHSSPPAAADAVAGADSTPPSVDPDTVFDMAVDAAVRRFQRRYGIVVDGSVGPRTFAAMNVPVRARIEQIELNLERWRSLPHDLGASYMLVNVPAETLDIVDDTAPVMRMKVVVGDVDHPTPVVRTFMVAVTFNPTWTIPASIVTKEIVPKSKRDHSYLLTNQIVFTPGRGWQQMAGPKNPLGQIKFETPNRFDVYLHDTPSRAAFDRFFRAQSHGCVRLERAAELAGFVLHDMGWNEGQVDSVASSGESRRVDLKRRWRVYLLYATSFVDEDGTMEFRDDLYGRDARLRDALATLRAAQRQAAL
jgi:L,D-transpeptidase YcbB